MSSSKAALKAIAASIQAQNYENAVEQAKNVLSADSSSYQANLFLGFAYDKQDKFADAENSYLAASKTKGGDPQSWQGLIKLYERQGGEKLSEYQKAALNLSEIYMQQDEKYKCQDVIDKFTSFAQKNGSRQQYKESLAVVLPSSAVYEYLAGRLPQPAHTFQRIADITEAEEKERVNKEIGERRTRLGAKLGQVTLDVKREVWENSPLEDIYAKIIDWSSEDEVRRTYEEKLLQRCYDVLTVLPANEKSAVSARVQKLATDMVIIKHPFQLAWEIAIEWQDHEAIHEWDAGILREFCSFFPDSGLAKVLNGFMTSEISLFPAGPSAPDEATESRSEDSDDDEEGGARLLPSSAEDRLVLMTDGAAEATASILAHRLLGEYFSHLEEYESLTELMRTGRQLVTAESAKTGLSFKNGWEALTGLYGTALVFYQSPKNHPQAKTLFDSILETNPKSTAALIGVGLIYEEEDNYPAAIDFFERALQRNPSDIRINAEAAWVKALNGDYENSKQELEFSLEKMTGSDRRARELRAVTQYRIGICIWNVDSSKAARKNRNGAYAFFLAALKSNMNFAPAYTSLGIFYADCLKDKKRARKCFQKACELSASEVEAAERLARAFADQGEWELVEAVSQRVVDSGKIRPAPGSKKKGISWPYAALGVAELNKQDYAKSIVSFQSALRISPEDYHSWVGLGEGYHNSGRYIAATRAFQHAEKFETQLQETHGDPWFSRYMLANVKRELGQYEEAINGYRSALEQRPEEFGVSIALIQTLVESAWVSIEKGLYGQATQLVGECIGSAKSLATSNSNSFNMWKSLGDACSVFTSVKGKITDFPFEEMKTLLQIDYEDSHYALFADIDGVKLEKMLVESSAAADEKEAVMLSICSDAAILCHKRAIEASAQDIHAQAVAHYNLGSAEHRAHVCLHATTTETSKRYLKAAVRSFKRAIELEAGNAEFWNALGVVTSDLNPKVSQHSFVRSLHLNERNSQTWVNLGGFYLLQNDYQLANEAFTRAQSTDPDFAHAWLGQGLVALLLGDPKEANLLFSHAIEVAESSSLLTKRQYSLSAFDAIIESTVPPDIKELLQPLLSLNQLLIMSPNELSFQHLSSLFLERVQDVSTAMSKLIGICSKLEADYEVSESPSSLSLFALAKADLARTQLASQDYEGAIDSGETSLQLSAEDAGNDLSVESRQRCRLSAHITVGLAHYYLDKPEQVLEYFEAALGESSSNADVVCLLAQVFWASGTVQAREKARDLLFECVEKHAGHVQSVLLLGVSALLDGDAETIDAVTAELLILRSGDSVSDEQRGQIGEVLGALTALAVHDDAGQKDDGGEMGAAELADIQRDVLLFPGQPHGWSRLAAAEGDEFAADMALKTALKAAKTADAHGELGAEVLSGAFAGTGKTSDAQSAVMVAPWSVAGWDALYECVCKD